MSQCLSVGFFIFAFWVCDNEFNQLCFFVFELLRWRAWPLTVLHCCWRSAAIRGGKTKQRKQQVCRPAVPPVMWVVHDHPATWLPVWGERSNKEKKKKIMCLGATDCDVLNVPTTIYSNNTAEMSESRHAENTALHFCFCFCLSSAWKWHIVCLKKFSRVRKKTQNKKKRQIQYCVFVGF